MLMDKEQKNEFINNLYQELLPHWLMLFDKSSHDIFPAVNEGESARIVMLGENADYLFQFWIHHHYAHVSIVRRNNGDINKLEKMFNDTSNILEATLDMLTTFFKRYS